MAHLYHNNLLFFFLAYRSGINARQDEGCDVRPHPGLRLLLVDIIVLSYYSVERKNKNPNSENEKGENKRKYFRSTELCESNRKDRLRLKLAELRDSGGTNTLRGGRRWHHLASGPQHTRSGSRQQLAIVLYERLPLVWQTG